MTINSVLFRALSISLISLVFYACSAVAPPPADAQIDSIMVVAGEAADDTAGVALGIARGFRAEGQDEAAAVLLEYIIEHYPGTPEAEEAQELLAAHLRNRSVGRGETQFIVWNTIFATWLGLAIPISVSSEDAGAYGAALLVAPPVGFFASRAYTKSRPITLGQSGAYVWSTVWGTWQAIGWREVLEIADDTENPGAKAAIVGGVVGIGTGLILANQNIQAGDATLATHASLWGTFYGLTIGALADLEDDDLLASTLVGGNVGLLVAIPGARATHPARGQVWVVSAAGIAGGLAGLGLDLIAQPDDDKTAILIPTAGVTVGLIAGALLTQNTKWKDESSLEPWDGSLLAFNDGASLGFPLPRPGTVTTFDAKARRKLVPSWEVRLVQASF